ncbi:MAG: glycosyltransferase [Pseudomonadota bacterium]
MVQQGVTMVALFVLPALAAWLFLMVLRGGFWRADQLLPAAKGPEHWPSVAAIIPARNEAATIRQVIDAHRRCTYPGELKVFLCDDHSDDGTAEQASLSGGSAPLEIVAVPDLQPGWSGKLWAMKAGLTEVEDDALNADYVLFTDADIVVDENLLTRLMAKAEKDGLALTSIMARLDDRGFWGGLLIPAFIFFFQKLYPFPLINDLTSHVAGAAGGVMLVKRDALQKIGGLEAMRGALIDDCSLAERIKNTEPRAPIGLYLSSTYGGATSLRDNRSFASLELMVARTAYTQLQYNPLLLIGTLIGMTLIYLIAPLAVITAPFHQNLAAFSLGLVTWSLMSFAYRPTLTRYGRRAREAFALPIAALFYGWFTWLSAWRHWRGRGGQWKGRSYPAGQTRKV